MTDAAGNVTLNAFNDAGDLISTTDTLGRTTSYLYDEQHRLVRVTDALGSETVTSYTSNGNVASPQRDGADWRHRRRGDQGASSLDVASLRQENADDKPPQTIRVSATRT